MLLEAELKFTRDEISTLLRDTAASSGYAFTSVIEWEADGSARVRVRTMTLDEKAAHGASKPGSNSAVDDVARAVTTSHQRVERLEELLAQRTDAILDQLAKIEARARRAALKEGDAERKEPFAEFFQEEAGAKK